MFLIYHISSSGHLLPFAMSFARHEVCLAHVSFRDALSMASICESVAFQKNFYTDVVVQLNKTSHEGDTADDSFTWKVYRRADNAELILHCYNYSLSRAQLKLVNFTHASFISHEGLFPFLESDRPNYILMEKADLRLKDLVYAVPDKIKLREAAIIVYGVGAEASFESGMSNSARSSTHFKLWQRRRICDMVTFIRQIYTFQELAGYSSVSSMPHPSLLLT